MHSSFFWNPGNKTFLCHDIVAEVATSLDDYMLKNMLISFSFPHLKLLDRSISSVVTSLLT
jgi:hypothetical protein